jgi:glycosyltransferase involved in cell wall biosynthesis
MGGEEYKNQLLFAHLSACYTTYVVDTHQWKKRLYVLCSLINKLFFYHSDVIIISASSQSVYKLVTMLQYFPFVARRSVYFVIGGYFPAAVLNGTFKLKPYRALKSIVVQGQSLKQTLQNAGYNGTVHVLPNFKHFPKELGLPNKVEGVFKFLFLSRIHPDKGVNEIFEANNLLKKWGLGDFSITFYGPMEENYRDQFESAIDSNRNIIYGGVLDIIRDTENAYKTLAAFDCMLFPTYWKGEGFPGVLVDAFVVGLPVIASDWNMNSEIIKNKQNGILIPPKDSIALAHAMRQIIESVDCRNLMSNESASCAASFHIDTVWHQIKEIIEA